MLLKQSTTLFSYFTFCNIRLLNACLVFYNYVHIHTFMMKIWITRIPFWLCWYFVFSIFERTVHYVITTWTIEISFPEWVALLYPKHNIKQQFVRRDSWNYVVMQHLTLSIISLVLVTIKPSVNTPPCQVIVSIVEILFTRFYENLIFSS